MITTEQQTYLKAWMLYRITVIHGMKYSSKEARVIETEMLNGALAYANATAPAAIPGAVVNHLPPHWIQLAMASAPVITPQEMKEVQRYVMALWPKAPPKG